PTLGRRRRGGGNFGSRRRVAEERRQRGFERRSVREPILQRQDDYAQLGHRASLGLQINRLRVEQRASNRNHDQRSPPHVRSLLIPQGQLTRELRVLINPRFHLP